MLFICKIAPANFDWACWKLPAADACPCRFVVEAESVFFLLMYVRHFFLICNCNFGVIVGGINVLFAGYLHKISVGTILFSLSFWTQYFNVLVFLRSFPDSAIFWTFLDHFPHNFPNFVYSALLFYEPFIAME